MIEFLVEGQLFLTVRCAWQESEWNYFEQFLENEGATLISWGPRWGQFLVEFQTEEHLLAFLMRFS